MFSPSRKFLFSSFLRKQESSFFGIPGRVSLARNDNPTFPKLSNPGSPLAKPGGLPKGNYLSEGNQCPISVKCRVESVNKNELLRLTSYV